MLEKEFFPIYSDLIFKNLFGTEKNTKFTIDLLEKLFSLEEGTLSDAVIDNSVVLDRETVKEKRFSLDIVVKLKNGDTFNIEMQKVYDENAERKNFIYVAGLFYSQLKRGEAYNKLKKTTGINFVKDLRLHKNDRIIQRYVMTNEDKPEDKILPELFHVLVIDVDQKSTDSYNEVSETFNEWRHFIGADTLEELENISESNPLLKEALKESIRFMSEDYVQDYSREEALIKSQMDSMKEKGILEGKLEEKFEIVLKMINNNEPLDKISLYTGLSMEELEKLKEEAK